MARDVEQLVLSISADTAQIRRALKRLEGDTARSTRNIERQFSAMNTRMNASAVALGRTMIGVFAGVASARGAQQLIDQSVRIENALKVTGLEGQALTKVYDDLFAAAQRNYAPLESLVSLYSRVALAQNELGVSSQEIVGFTDTIAMALRVQGVSAVEASGALTQLSQSLAGGVVRAEEFNSIVEGAPSILRAAAAGIAEADGSIAKLRQIMLDGELSSQAFFRGIEAGSHILEDQLAGAGVTVSGAFITLQNVLVDAARKLNEGTDASETLAGAIEWLSDAIANTDFGPLINNISNAIGAMAELVEWVDRAGAALGALTGLDQVGPALRNRVEQSNINERLDSAFAAAAPKGDRPTALPAIEARATERPQPISLADYTPPASAGGGGGGGRGRRGGGGGGGAARRAEEYARLTERIKEATAAQQAETAALAAVNPLVDDYGFSVEKARMEHELLTAAQKDGRTITPQLRAEIAGLAESYAMATSEAAKLAETQNDIRDAAEEMARFNQDLARGIVDGFLEGKDAAEVFADALKKVADRLLDMAFDSIFSSGGGGGIFGFLGSLFGGGKKIIPGFANGTNYAPGGMALVGERGPELVNLPRGSQVVPNNKIGGMQAVKVDVGVSVDDDGKVQAYVRSMGQQAAQAGAAVAVGQVRNSMPQLIANAQTRSM